MYRVIVLLAAALLVGADQLTKALAQSCLRPVGSVPLIPGAFSLTYVENTGAAFGIFKNQRWIFLVLTTVVMLVVLAALMSGRFRQYRTVNIAGTLILAGGIGNMIDRVAHGYVVDFLHYHWGFEFPVFNVADICVVIGAAVLLVFFFFLYREEERQPANQLVSDTLPETPELAGEPMTDMPVTDSAAEQVTAEKDGETDGDTEGDPTDYSAGESR